MNKENYIINIDDLENAPNKTILLDFEENVEGINSKTPIKASLEITSLGNYIQVKGKVKGSVTLECDLCLNEFQQELDFEIDELLAKDSVIESYGLETELKEGQFVTDLYGSKDIDVYDLLYQSVILDLPNKKVCGINCKGNDFLSDENLSQDESDPRLEVFKTIQIKNPKK